MAEEAAEHSVSNNEDKDSDSNLESLYPIRVLLDDAFRRLDETYQPGNRVTGLSTGFRDLDYITGGLQGGDLIVVAGLPAMAKTSLCLNITRNIVVGEVTTGEDGKQHTNPRGTVAMFCLAHSKEQVIHRLICADAKVNAHHLNTGFMHDDGWTALAESVQRLWDGRLFVSDRCGMPASEMRKICHALHALKEEHGLDLIIVDYLQLVGAEDNPNGFAEVWDAARDLKALARQIDVPVIAVCPINRSHERRADKRPLLTDLPPIEQYADLVALMYRSSQYDMVTIEEEQDKSVNEGGEELDVIIAKQNAGPVGTLRLIFYPATVRVEDMHEDEDALF